MEGSTQEAPSNWCKCGRNVRFLEATWTNERSFRFWKRWERYVGIFGCSSVRSNGTRRGFASYLSTGSIHLLRVGLRRSSKVWIFQLISITTNNHDNCYYSLYNTQVNRLYLICSWLQRDPDMLVRQNYQPYLDRVKIYFDQLLPLVADLQFTRGGSIIAVQVYS